jgi:hypothetical protein
MTPPPQYGSFCTRQSQGSWVWYKTGAKGFMDLPQGKMTAVGRWLPCLSPVSLSLMACLLRMSVSALPSDAACTNVRRAAIFQLSGHMDCGLRGRCRDRVELHSNSRGANCSRDSMCLSINIVPFMWLSPEKMTIPASPWSQEWPWWLTLSRRTDWECLCNFCFAARQQVLGAGWFSLRVHWEEWWPECLESWSCTSLGPCTTAGSESSNLKCCLWDYAVTET